MKKGNDVKDDKNIQGFDNDLNDESLNRIDRLVTNMNRKSSGS
ncbi:hypothetical protein [Sporolactobacillus shoreae]|nr:hypothetical protein [Sporolactobacillus shoreae]